MSEQEIISPRGPEPTPPPPVTVQEGLRSTVPWELKLEAAIDKAKDVLWILLIGFVFGVLAGWELRDSKLQTAPDEPKSSPNRNDDE